MENSVKKNWDTKGVAAAVLSIPGYFWAAILFVIYMLKLNAFKNVTVIQLVLFVIAINIIPVIQIILGIISLKKNPESHKWPAIVGIVLGLIGTVFFSVILIGAYR